MMKGKGAYLSSAVSLLLFLLMSSEAFSQQTDTLREAEVRSRKYLQTKPSDKWKKYTPGMKQLAIDSATLQRYRQQNVAEMLEREVPVFVKSYGFNNLATLHFRGASAAQSTVIWNGVPLQNAALGLTDISLVPVGIADEVSIAYGSSSALLGSGNVGGAVVINSTPEKDTAKLSADAFMGMGSFFHYYYGGKMGFSKAGFTARIRAMGQQAKNNFPFINSNNQQQEQSNAALAGGTLALDAAYSINHQNSMTLHGWLQGYKREIPPALFQQKSQQELQDEALRIALKWNHIGTTGWYINTSWIQDQLHFEDKSIALNSQSVVNTFFTEAGAERNLGKSQRILLFFPIQVSTMVAPSGRQYTQQRVAIAVAHRLQLGKAERFNLATNLRAEIVNNNSYLLPGANAAYQLRRWIVVKANVQKTYRVPTLNELYFEPGGNKNLQPEQGWNLDGGYAMNFTTQNGIDIRHEMAAYHRRIDNWVAWFGGSIWTPHNIGQVLSRGLEGDFTINKKIEKSTIEIRTQVSYNSSITTKSVIPNDNSIGAQVPYAPRWIGLAGATFTQGKLFVQYTQSFTGIRYVTTDQSLEVAAFSLGSVQLGWWLGLGKSKVRADAQVNNILDKNYQVVSNRPMPGRSFRINLTFAYW